MAVRPGEENKPWFRWDFGSVDPIGYESLLGGIFFLNHDAAFGRGVGVLIIVSGFV